MGSHKSKEDDVSKISTSIFITNFPVTFSAKDLFNACKQYGHVVDAYIPIKRSKAGKRRSTHVYQKDMGQSGVGNSYVQVVKGNNTSVVAESDHTPTLVLDFIATFITSDAASSNATVMSEQASSIINASTSKHCILQWEYRLKHVEYSTIITHRQQPEDGTRQ
ncbi:nucleotide-binding alpha-beta plait domain-containing protein [Tanacetum coccineum]